MIISDLLEAIPYSMRMPVMGALYFFLITKRENYLSRNSAVLMMQLIFCVMAHYVGEEHSKNLYPDYATSSSPSFFNAFARGVESSFHSLVAHNFNSILRYWGWNNFMSDKASFIFGAVIEMLYACASYPRGMEAAFIPQQPRM